MGQAPVARRWHIGASGQHRYDDPRQRSDIVSVRYEAAAKCRTAHAGRTEVDQAVTVIERPADDGLAVDLKVGDPPGGVMLTCEQAQSGTVSAWLLSSALHS